MGVDQSRYSVVAMALHWLTALLILALLVIGYSMVNVKLGFGTKFQLYQLHKSLGVTVFLLTAVRLFWRLGHPAPALPEDMKHWEKALARFSHAMFYVLLIALPLSGWVRVSGASFNIETVLFGVIPLPHIPFIESLSADTKKVFEPAAQLTHFGLAVSMVVLLVLHVAGALKHQFVDGAGVMHRMWPFGK